MTGIPVERRLAAILAADVAGFSALMECDEEGTYARIGDLRRNVFEPLLSEHHGRLIKTTGDGFLAEFASPIAALRCAIAIQSKQSDDPEALQLRIGLNLGDIIIEGGGDVYGEGVNIAARLESIAEPGEILISGKIYGEVESKVEADFEDRGERSVKNITRPVRIYAVRKAKASGTSAAIYSHDISQAAQHPDKPSIAVLPWRTKILRAADASGARRREGTISLHPKLITDLRSGVESDAAAEKSKDRLSRDFWVVRFSTFATISARRRHHSVGPGIKLSDADKPQLN
jgi:class 3 adenylate cyclase